MNLKRFGILSMIFVSIILVLIIVLSCIKTTTVMACENPSTIVIYNHNRVPQGTYTKESTTVKYEKLFDEFKQIGKLSILDRAVHKIKINETLSQDVSKKYPSWGGDSYTEKNLCMELKFDSVQRQIVYVKGDSKLIEYKRIIFVVPEDGKTQEVAIYFMISDGSSYSEKGPMLINANCSRLVKLIKSL